MMSNMSVYYLYIVDDYFVINKNGILWTLSSRLMISGIDVLAIN